MPKPNKQRGRRMKRKHEDDPEDPVEESASKRRKSIDGQLEENFLPLEVQDQDMSAAYPVGEKVFFGMLDEQEQEYYKYADEQLDETHQAFETAEDREKFINDFWGETDGKAIKVAHSQSCSRILERFIRIATPAQLKLLFQQFSGK